MASCTAGSKSCTPIEIRLKPSAARSVELACARAGGIGFDGHFGVGRDLEALGQRRPQPGQARLVEKRGRAAAEVDAGDAAPPAQLRGHQLDLVEQRRQVAIDAPEVVGDDHVAAAIAAQRRAERNVQVERERLIDAAERAQVIGRAEIFVPGGDGRIAGVARTGHVQLLQELVGDLHAWAQCTPRTWTVGRQFGNFYAKRRRRSKDCANWLRTRRRRSGAGRDRAYGRVTRRSCRWPPRRRPASGSEPCGAR